MPARSTASLVREWMRLDWQTAYPGLGYAPLRESLLQHLDALLAEPLPQMQLDGELVTAARARIADGAAGAAGLFAHPPVRRGAAACRHGGRAMRWAPPACRCSCARPASR